MVPRYHNTLIREVDADTLNEMPAGTIIQIECIGRGTYDTLYGPMKLPATKEMNQYLIEVRKENSPYAEN